MTSVELREIIYHCECRRFIAGAPVTTCFCHECGREHAPAEYSVVNEAVGGF